MPRLSAAVTRSKPPPAGHLLQMGMMGMMGIPIALPLELLPETTRCQSSSLGIALARSAGETHRWRAAPVAAKCGHGNADVIMYAENR